MDNNVKDPSANYIKMIVYVFLGFGAFVLAIVSAYFAFVGLYFGQGIVEQDVFSDKYKYECNLLNGSEIVDNTGECTSFNKSAELTSWADYQESRGIINSLIPKFLIGTFVIFSLLGLVFLFLALRSAGIGTKKKETSSKDEW